jgi:hypothetical protein
MDSNTVTRLSISFIFQLMVVIPLFILLMLPFILVILLVGILTPFSKSLFFLFKLDISPFKSDISLLINITFASRIPKLIPIVAAPASIPDMCD